MQRLENQVKKVIAIALAAARAVVLVRGKYDLRLANRAKALLGSKSIRSSQRSKLRGNSIKVRRLSKAEVYGRSC